MSEHERQVTFRTSSDKIDKLDRLISAAKGRGDLPLDANRSDLLRQCVDDLIDELEDDQGNANPIQVPAAD